MWWSRPAANRPSTEKRRDRKSTRLNSSHVEISYAVFCLKKKKKILDADTLELANAIAAMIEDPAVEGGELQPELHESVLEWANAHSRTTPAPASHVLCLR